MIRMPAIACLMLLAACRSGDFRESATYPRAREIWLSTCAACHGPNGNPAPGWENKGMRRFGTFGMRMGFFFGGDKMRLAIAKTISNGKGEQMPAFKEIFSQAEIADLVKYIESL